MSSVKVNSEFAGNLKKNELTVAEIDPELVAELNHPVAQGYIDLRTITYRERGYLNESLERDVDNDDLRSIHFAALESNQNGTANVLGTMRLIRKTTFNDPLPIEELGVELKPGTVEISRMIAETGRQSPGLVRTRLFQVALASKYHEATQAVAMVDPWFRGYLKDKVKVPIVDLTDGEKKLQRYPENQVGIDVNFPVLYYSMGAKAVRAIHTEEGIMYFGV